MLTPDKMTVKPEAVEYNGDTLYIRRLTAGDLLKMGGDPRAKEDFYMAALYWGDENNRRLITTAEEQASLADMPSDFVVALVREGERVNGTSDADEATAEVEKP